MATACRCTYLPRWFQHPSPPPYRRFFVIIRSRFGTDSMLLLYLCRPTTATVLPDWASCRQLGDFFKLLSAKIGSRRLLWRIFGYFLNQSGNHEFWRLFTRCWRLFVEKLPPAVTANGRPVSGGYVCLSRCKWNCTLNHGRRRLLSPASSISLSLSDSSGVSVTHAHGHNIRNFRSARLIHNSVYLYQHQLSVSLSVSACRCAR